MATAKFVLTTEEQLLKHQGGDSRNKIQINRMSLWSIQTVNEKEVILTLDKCHDNSQKCAHNRRTTYKASYKCTYLINVRRHTKIHDKRLSSNVKRRYQCDQNFTSYLIFSWMIYTLRRARLFPFHEFMLFVVLSLFAGDSSNAGRKYFACIGGKRP